MDIDDLNASESLVSAKDGTSISQKVFQKDKNARGLISNEKKDAVHAELNRVNKLPSHSAYAVHRLRVLNKILHLMSIQRTTSLDEELELLFASLSL